MISSFSKQTHILALPDPEGLQGRTDSDMKERHKLDISTPREFLFLLCLYWGKQMGKKWSLQGTDGNEESLSANHTRLI